MEAVSSSNMEDKTDKIVSDVDEYRESVRKLIDDEVKNALDEELRKAAQELIEEQKRAITEIVEEHRSAIKQVVEEEKKEIWAKAKALRKSIQKIIQMDELSEDLPDLEHVV